MRGEAEVHVTGAGQASVLVVEDEPALRKLVEVALGRAGYSVVLAANGREALERLAEATPDLIVSDVMMPELDGLDLLTRLRQDPATRTIPFILLTARASVDDIVKGLDLGADDYLTKPFQMAELLARAKAKIERPPLPSELLPQDRRTGLLTTTRFLSAVERDLIRTRPRARGALAVLQLYELPQVRTRLGKRAEDELAKQTATLLASSLSHACLAARDVSGAFLLFVPDLEAPDVRTRLRAITRKLAGHTFQAGGERIRLTPTVGYALAEPERSAADLLSRARVAAGEAALHLDLEPARYTPELDEEAARSAARRSAERQAGRWVRFRQRLRLAAQIALTFVFGIVLPWTAYVLLAAAGWDITPHLYTLIVLGLLGTAVLIWAEGFLALRRIDPPDEPALPYPPASAIIAAYLPNEAATIVETVEAFLRVDYPVPLQIVLAYNTPRSLPVEDTLREISARDPRLLLLRVEGSTSKAQNVNAALSELAGEFVGIFDADHHPDPDSFSRAWRWLSRGWDVVQGHCMIRNGDASWVARMAAVEFEGMYAVAHPGRARLHGFGIFGGSNGYWKTDLLRRTRMHGFMLTEDIDSSLRVVEEGYRIQSDPWLISRELAPATLGALWNQRLRWAQGWFQVSKKHIPRVLASTHLTWRQKLGMLHLLAWRELFPWLALQILPILAFWIVVRGLGTLDWAIPVFVFTTFFTLGTGPGQAFFIRRAGHPEVTDRRGWILWYIVVAFFFYSGFKNLIARLAQVKELMKETAWKVTPRTGGAPRTSVPG